MAFFIVSLRGVKMNYLLEKYKRRLVEMPAPGNGCHQHIMSAANYGAMAGLSYQQVKSDIRHSIPQGRRTVPDHEILAAVEKAFSEHGKRVALPNGEQYQRYMVPRQPPVVKDGKSVLRHIIGQGIASTEDDLRALSPVPLDETPKNQLILFLNTLYAPHEILWAGNQLEKGVVGKNIMSVADWLQAFRSRRPVPPFFIINPLSGKAAAKKTGIGTTFRGDQNVISFKYALVEFDTLTFTEQSLFWSAVKLPLRSLVYTGGKSIHALLDVQKIADIKTYTQWQSIIKNYLFDRYLSPLGVDSNCSNPGRLSRLPGHYRTEKNNLQRLLWLSSEGRRINNGNK